MSPIFLLHKVCKLYNIETVSSLAILDLLAKESRNSSEISEKMSLTVEHCRCKLKPLCDSDFVIYSTKNRKYEITKTGLDFLVRIYEEFKLQTIQHINLPHHAKTK